MSNSGGQGAGTVSGSGAASIPTSGSVPVVLPLVNDSSNFQNVVSVRNLAEPNSGNSVSVAAQVLGVSGSQWVVGRTPNVFKSGPVTAAGSTGQWAPAAGKKFRLMKYQMILTGQATLGVAGNLVIDLLDNATSLGLAVSMFVPAAAVNTLGGFATPWIDLGNGVLSAVANNVLNVSLNVALTAGQLRVLTIGTEE